MRFPLTLQKGLQESESRGKARSPIEPLRDKSIDFIFGYCFSVQLLFQQALNKNSEHGLDGLR